jgi:NitT/TauT family transport system ATP-binding protein/nitrate/nitrite transport system substrate-binding protein
MNTDNKFNVGYLKLTDAAPFIIAQEQGFFSKYDLQVTLTPQNSWATLRDKLEAGLLDAAHMLAPMPLASAMGISGARQDIITPLITSQNGNGITISSALCNEIVALGELESMPFPMSASLLKKSIESRSAKNQAKLRFATVFPFSCHYLQFLDYLAQGNIESSDIEFLFIPPISMADSLFSAEIDGFSVGGPYNAASVRRNCGSTIVTSYDIWEDRAEKVLGITQSSYNQRPLAYQKLCAAIIDACEWLKDVPNRFEAARLLAQEQYLDTSIDNIAPSLIGSCLTSPTTPARYLPNYNRFSSIVDSDAGDAYLVNRPTIEQGEWLLLKMQKAWPSLVSNANNKVILEDCFREDIFSLALACRK